MLGELWGYLPGARKLRAHHETAPTIQNQTQKTLIPGPSKSNGGLGTFYLLIPLRHTRC